MPLRLKASPSIFKSLTTSSVVAWVLNNLTGHIVKRGQLPDRTVSTAQITQKNVAAYCSTVSNTCLLSGVVRFSRGATANSELVVSPSLPLPLPLPLPLSLSLSLAIITAGTTNPRAPPHDWSSNARLAGPIKMPESVVSCCAVDLYLVGVAWTSWLILNGIELGNASLHICRYSADYSGDYSGDETISNMEHPLDYVDVNGSLTRQIFLVVAGSQSCSVGRIPNPADGLFCDSKTVESPEKL